MTIFEIAGTDMTIFEIADTDMTIFETADTDADIKIFETADTDMKIFETADTDAGMDFLKNRGHGNGTDSPRTRVSADLCSKLKKWKEKLEKFSGRAI